MLSEGKLNVFSRAAGETPLTNCSILFDTRYYGHDIICWNRVELVETNGINNDTMWRRTISPVQRTVDVL